jgi:protease I
MTPLAPSGPSEKASFFLIVGVLLFAIGCTDETRADQRGGPLAGKRVAILVDQGFEESELTEPREVLDEAGAITEVVSPQSGRVRAWDQTDWGTRVRVDTPLGGADAAAYDALLLPGGVINPDRLRMNPQAVAFVRAFVVAGKPIAAICHGPWTLIEANGVRERRMTSWPSLKNDLLNAGADWVDASVVRDGTLVTSRKPDDIPEFNRAMIDMFSNVAPRTTP